jgi:hypothetical protein
VIFRGIIGGGQAACGGYVLDVNPEVQPTGHDTRARKTELAFINVVHRQFGYTKGNWKLILRLEREPRSMIRGIDKQLTLIAQLPNVRVRD